MSLEASLWTSDLVRGLQQQIPSHTSTHVNVPAWGVVELESRWPNVVAQATFSWETTHPRVSLLTSTKGTSLNPAK